MKKVTFLLALAAAFTLNLTFTSCDEKENLDKEQAGDIIKAYLPIEYANKQVAAWYMLTDQSDNKTKIEAVFLFTDSTLAVTKVKFYSESDGRKPEYDINATGRYKIKEGDYTTGKADVITSGGDAFEVNIKNGILYAMNEEFTKMSNSLLPSAYNPNGGGNNNQGGDIIKAYLPIEYANKQVAAWYMLTDKSDNKTKIEAVFLFTDSTLAVTKVKIYDESDGRKPEYDINATGRYKITEGDFTTGKADVITSGGEAFEVNIQNGKLYAMNEVFTKMSNALIPSPYNPNGGGNNQGGDNDMPPFFPKSYADKNISAWYSSSESEAAQGYVFNNTSSIYFFEDNTFVTTLNTSTSSQHGQHSDRLITAEGSYQVIEGNFTTGKITITDDKNSMTVEIQDGQLKIKDTETPEVSIYFKQDNSKLPQPSEPTENGNQGGDYQDEQGPAFFPTTYDINKVIAWYSYTESEPMETRVEAVFLLNNDTVLVTEHKIFEQSIQMPDDRNIFVIGSYTLSGNYDNGTADVTIIDGYYFQKGSKKNITITNGNLVMEYDNNSVYTRRDLKDLPEPLEPRNQGGNGQGGNGQGGGDDVTGNTIYGTWIDDLANPYGTLTLNSNGTGTMWYEDFDFTYKDDTLVYDQESKYVITIDGDVMTWAYIDEEYGMMEPQVWYRSNATFDKQVSTGRWNGLMGEDGSDCGIVYFFYENEVEFYIIAWGEQFKGSFTHEGGIINFNLREGYNARIGQEGSWSWEAGNLDPETLRLTEGYEWRQMDNEVLSERKQELEKFTFALVSDVKAYGSLFSQTMTIVKAK